MSAGILQAAVKIYEETLKDIGLVLAQATDSDTTRQYEALNADVSQKYIKVKGDASIMDSNASLIESEDFIKDVNELLKLFGKPQVSKGLYDMTRAMAYEVNRRLSSKEGYIKFERTPYNDRYNRVLEGVVQIIYRNEYNHVLVNPWGYDSVAFKLNIAELAEQFSKIYFVNIVKGIREILREKGSLTNAPPKAAPILKRISGLSDADLAGLSADQLAYEIIAPLVNMHGGMSIFKGMEEKFLVYSAGPGTGKGEVMDAIFTIVKGKYADLIDKLILYHTRDARVKKGVSEKDGIAYHFRTESQLKELERLGKIIIALVNRQMQGLAGDTFEEEIIIPVKDLDNDKQGVILPTDRVIERTADHVKIGRMINGSQAIFDGAKPVILEGGYGWFRALNKFKKIETVFIAPFNDTEMETRAKNTAWINRTFASPGTATISSGWS